MHINYILNVKKKILNYKKNLYTAQNEVYVVCDTKLRTPMYSNMLVLSRYTEVTFYEHESPETVS